MATKKDAAPTPELKVNAEIHRFADAIEKELKLGEGGQFTGAQEVIDGLVSDTLTKQQEERANLIAGAGLALGRASVRAMVKDKNLEATTLDFNYGHDEVSFNYARTKDNPGNSKIPASTTYGILTPKYVAHGSIAARGAMKKIKTHLSQMAAGSLAN